MKAKNQQVPKNENEIYQLIESIVLKQLELGPRTRKILLTKIKYKTYRLGIGPEKISKIVSEVISKYEKKGWINERDYMDGLIRSFRLKSNKELVFKAQEAGVSNHIACEFLETMSTEKDRIIEVIIKKINPIKLGQDKDKNRLFRYLLGRGFALEQIKSAIDEITKKD